MGNKAQEFIQTVDYGKQPPFKNLDRVGTCIKEILQKMSHEKLWTPQLNERMNQNIYVPTAYLQS